MKDIKDRNKQLNYSEHASINVPRNMGKNKILKSKSQMISVTPGAPKDQESERSRRNSISSHHGSVPNLQAP
jgi:hypothetical protein